MGFTTGFTGGVTLTLSLAYLTVLAHQRNRERQSAVLRANTTVISGLTDPLPPVYPPTRTELAAKQREHFAELAKDRWNAEIEGAVRWAQETDWDEVRERAETVVGRLWAKAFGNALEEAEKGEQKASVVAGQAKDEVKREANSVLVATKSVASEKAGSVAAAAKSAYADAKARGAETVKKGEQDAVAAKSSIFGAVGRGIEKGKEALGLAKQKAAEAEQKLEDKVDEKLSPVERTLQQRYEKPSGVNQTVEQALAERYTPIDRRDNAVLRGL